VARQLRFLRQLSHRAICPLANWILLNSDGRHDGNSTAMDGNGRRDRDLKAMDGLSAMGSDSTVMDGTAGRQWTVRRDVNGWCNGSLMAMDGAAASWRR